MGALSGIDIDDDGQLEKLCGRICMRKYASRWNASVGAWVAEHESH